MPAVAWWPDTIPAGSTSDEVTSTLDIYPTLLELAGGNADGKICVWVLW